MNHRKRKIDALREIDLENDVPPAFQFRTLAKTPVNPKINRQVVPIEFEAAAELPPTDEQIAFLSVSKLSGLIKSRKLSSRRLTQIYLERLKRFGPMLRCVVNLTEALAIQQADAADAEIASGKYRGPLHGIPWGAKDLIAVPGLKIDDRPELKRLRDMGCELIEARIPDTIPIQTLAGIIDMEAAAGFDQLLRDGHTEGWNAWTDIFRSVQFVSAVDYIRMMRLRTRVMHEFEDFMAGFDFLYNVFDVFHTNLTGHPSIVMPQEYKAVESGEKLPVAVSVTGHLNQDQRLLAFARASQIANPKRENPPLEQWLEKYKAGELDRKPSEKALEN